LGGLTIRQAAAWSDWCNSRWFRTPVCMMNWILQNERCPRRWGHLNTPSQLQSNWGYCHEQCTEWCWELQLPLECLSCGVHQR
jgi:hypothetical protein